MSIEVQADLDLDSLPKGGLLRKVSGLEKRKAALATLIASPGGEQTIIETFCALRASGISPLLVLRAPAAPLATDHILAFSSFLRDWDQLLLRNLLELAGDRIAPRHAAALAQEAKIELKWFQEWQTAVSDPRIHRYPGLPWRSFLRKVNAENFSFLQELLRDDSSEEALDTAVKAFLVGKKKTICVFPKNWGKR